MKHKPYLTLLILAITGGLIAPGCNKKSDDTARNQLENVTDTNTVDTAAREKELQAARLDEKKQEFIFDSEHVTFVIEQVFGGEWKKAFKAGDAKKLKEFCFDEFTGYTIESEPYETLVASVITEKKRLRSADSQPKALDAAEFASYLASIRSQFEELDRLKFRILKISQPLESQPIWECRVLVDAVGKSQKKPKQYESEQVVVFEISNEAEIATHPVISEWRIEKEVDRDAEQFLTEEVTEETLINEVKLANNWELEVKHTEQYWFQYSVEDFDRDGKLDFAVACSHFLPRLFYNAEGNRFFNVTDERELVAAEGPTRIGKSFGCAWIDYDNDGYPDLIVGSKLFKNNAGKSFTDVTSQSGLVFYRECMGISVADYDCDGLLDIYALYQSPIVDKNNAAPKQWVNETLTGMENQLWKNMGGGKFVNYTKKANAGGGKRHTHAASWFFYDDDHFPDLYIANDFGKNVLLRNKGDGTFEDISIASKTSGYSTSMGVSTGDLNNDGLAEIYVANMYSKMGRRIIGQVSDSDYPEGIYEQIKGSCAGNRLYTRSGGTEFKEIGEQNGIHDVGWAFGPTFTDLDGNGLLDIYATAGFMSFARGKPDG